MYASVSEVHEPGTGCTDPAHSAKDHKKAVQGRPRGLWSQTIRVPHRAFGLMTCTISTGRRSDIRQCTAAGKLDSGLDLPEIPFKWPAALPDGGPHQVAYARPDRTVEGSAHLTPSS
jgi:hypothetical protein